jgi:hypothetical protein
MSTNQRIGLRVVVSLVAYIAACIAFVLFRGESLFLSVLAIFGVGLLAIRLHRVVREQVEEIGMAPWKQWSLIASVLALGLVVLLVGVVADLDGWGFSGMALLYIGVGLALGELRSWRVCPRREFAAALAASAGAIVVGLTAAALGLTWGWALAALGLVTAPIGIALVSEIALRRLWSRGPWRSLLLTLAGLALLVISLAVVESQGIDRVFLVVAGVIAVVAMVGIAARSNVDVVFVVVAAAVVWTLGQQGVPVPERLDPSRGDPVVVALGDSYISGEGADSYYEGTNTPGTSTCRRAPTAYPPQLIVERRVAVPDHLAFVACSGAKVREVVGPDGAGETQVTELLSRVGPDEIAFALVSMGGNDALFGAIGRACLRPVDCTDLAPAFYANLASVGETLDIAYAELREQLAGVPVLVVPYPVPVYPDSCAESVLSSAEHRFLHGFTQRLNGTVAASARRAGFEVVDTMPDALVGLQLCDDEAEDVGVNFLAANSVSGTVEQSLNPTNWVHNSLHPNARGHEAMRSALVAWLERHPDLGPPGPPQGAPAPTVPAVSSGSPCLGERQAALGTCADEWAARLTAQFVLRWGGLLVPVLVGAWLLALQLVRLWWAVFGPPTIVSGETSHDADAEPATTAPSQLVGV